MACVQNGLPPSGPQVPSLNNKPDELFYFASSVDYPLPGAASVAAGFTLRYENAVEGAYADGAIRPGDEMVFQRTRFTIGCPDPDPPVGTYLRPYVHIADHPSAYLGQSMYYNRCDLMLPSPGSTCWGVSGRVRLVITVL
jgi:hypothetical protein